MEIGVLRLVDLQFPDRAGELQRVGDTAALVRELGDRYAEYHDFLANEIAKIGKPPTQIRSDSSVVTGDMDAFTQTWGRIHEVVVAEMILRVCRSNLLEGRSLLQPADQTVPLFDARYRLLSVETGLPLANEPGAVEEGFWGVPKWPEFFPPEPKR